MAANTVTPIGNEIILINSPDGAGHPSAVTSPATVTSLVNFSGSTTLAAATSATSNTTLALTGLVTTVQAGGTYIFDIYLSVTNNASGGLKIAPGGTATATSFAADTWFYNTTTVAAQANITALASNFAALTGAVTTVNVTGTILVNAGGTFGLQFAQNASFGTATTLNIGSYLWMERVS